MNKKQLIEKLRTGTTFKIISPKIHGFYNKPRKADIVQTNSIRFDGGSWLYFKSIKPENITATGFKIDDLMGGWIEYKEVN